MEKFTVFSDIEGYKTEHGGTFPSYLTVTTDRPDMVSIDKTQKRVLICELTVPFESNITARHTYKSDKYAYLLQIMKHHCVHLKLVPAPLCPPLH